MKKFYSVIFLILIAVIFFSCEKDKEDEAEENNIIIKTLGNNSSILEGDSIGVNSENNDSLRKAVDIELLHNTDNFHIDKAYICRSSSTASQINWIIPAENISDNPLVFIKANNIQFKNSQLNLIGGDEEEYIFGELGQENITLTTTFLSAGARGYFAGTKKLRFDEIKKIEINNIESATNNFHTSSIEVIPISYILDDNKIIVKVKNKSKETIYAIVSPYILLDHENIPLFWDYMEPVEDSTKTVEVIEINPGETVNFEDYIDYKGGCNRILPILEFGLNPY
jgi:hypothetical protein